MEIIINQTFDQERSFYGSKNIHLMDCRFDGPADGESAFKESENIITQRTHFNLRYPFWHTHGIKISGSDMSEFCRAALWYSDHIEITNTNLNGIKALRECADVSIKECEIHSPEFGWSSSKVYMSECVVESEYFMMRAEDLKFNNVKLTGKYSFQYLNNGVFEYCEFNTKDSFWHAKNVVIRNSVIHGEYLGWYSENLTFENCTIIGTQPFCYCKNLKLIDCEMLEADLAFERSDVQASLTAPVISIKNPRSGTISVPSVIDLIRDDPMSKAELNIGLMLPM